jgi:hypothetical protein
MGRFFRQAARFLARSKDRLKGGNFAFENKATRCVYDVKFLGAPLQGAADWGLQKIPGSCPTGGLFVKVIAEDQPKSDNSNIQSGVVVYYRKIRDGMKVLDALKKRNITVREEKPILSNDFASNAVGCAPGASPKSIQEVAFALMDEGIVIRAVAPLSSGGSTVYILTEQSVPERKPLESEPLSREQISGLTRCPTIMLVNLVAFPNPRVSKVDDRQIGYWLFSGAKNDKEEGGLASAHLYCTRNGYHGVYEFSYGYATDPNDVSVNLMDQTTCRGQRCPIFTKIVCH